MPYRKLTNDNCWKIHKMNEWILISYSRFKLSGFSNIHHEWVDVIYFLLKLRDKKTPACQVSYIPLSPMSLPSWRLPRRWKLNDLSAEVEQGGGLGFGSFVKRIQVVVFLFFFRKKILNFKLGWCFLLGREKKKIANLNHSISIQCLRCILSTFWGEFCLFLPVLLSWDNKSREISG